MKPTHSYITLTMHGTKKIAVCGRRIGSRDRMAVMAMCTDETVAEKIVDALNALQGEISKLEAPALKDLAIACENLKRECARTSQLSREKADMVDKVRKTEDALITMRRERDRALYERDVAQKATLEKA